MSKKLTKPLVMVPNVPDSIPTDNLGVTPSYLENTSAAVIISNY